MNGRKGRPSGRAMTVGAVGAALLVGLGVLLYSVVGGQAPASANTPHKVSDQVTDEVQERFARSLPERVVERVRGPRVDAPEEKALKLTVPALERVRDVPVYDAAKGEYEDAMHDGTAHVRGTGFPWQKGANVYIAGHRVGFPGTNSDMAFYDLEDLANGDEIYVEDAEGRKYTYVVFNKKIVEPTDLSVLKRVEGKNILTLQTCTLPDYTDRVVYQAELKDVQV